MDQINNKIDCQTTKFGSWLRLIAVRKDNIQRSSTIGYYSMIISKDIQNTYHLLTFDPYLIYPLQYKIKNDYTAVPESLCYMYTMQSNKNSR